MAFLLFFTSLYPVGTQPLLEFLYQLEAGSPTNIPTAALFTLFGVGNNGCFCLKHLFP